MRARSAAVLLLVLAALLPALHGQSDNSTGAFTRSGPYSYQVCEEQPGEVPGVNVTGGGSRCIPIDPGSLTFCTGVSYVSCLRVPVPAAYDKLVSDAFTLRTTRLRLEFPSSAASLCTSAFQSYFCALSFPQCVAIDGVYVELPVCWSYCMQSEMACTSASVATKACTMGVKAGRVAPDRPDVRCMSCAPAFRQLWILVLTLCALLCLS